MRSVVVSKLIESRIRGGPMGTTDQDGLVGAFIVRTPRTTLKIISSGSTDEGMGWEHVSVSAPNRCPNWEEMCLVKTMFWSDEETVVQFHPARSKYINKHEFVLHLWKKIGQEHELPPSVLV